MKKDITSNRSKHWLEWNDYKQPKVKNYLLNLRERYGFSEFYFSDLLVIVNNGVKYLLSIDYNGAVLYYIIQSPTAIHVIISRMLGLTLSMPLHPIFVKLR